MQKIRKAAKAKILEKTEKRKQIEEVEKKKWLEYIKKLWDKVLVQNVTLMKSAENFQVMEVKHKKVYLKGKIELQPFKKAKEKQPNKYYRDIVIKMGDNNLCKRCVCARQDCLVYNFR